MLKLISCDYSGAYIVVKGIITVPNTGTAADVMIEIKRWHLRTVPHSLIEYMR